MVTLINACNLLWLRFFVLSQQKIYVNFIIQMLNEEIYRNNSIIVNLLMAASVKVNAVDFVLIHIQIGNLLGTLFMPWTRLDWRQTVQVQRAQFCGGNTAIYVQRNHSPIIFSFEGNSI